MKKEIKTREAPSPAGPYSQALVLEGNLPARQIYLAGTLPLDPRTNQIVGGTIEEQTNQVLQSIQNLLGAAGASMADVVKTTVHLDDISRIAGLNPIYERYFPDPKPVRTTVGSQLGPGLMVEIDVIAVVSA